MDGLSFQRSVVAAPEFAPGLNLLVDMDMMTAMKMSGDLAGGGALDS